MKLLLNEGDILVNQASNNGRTPVMLACQVAIFFRLIPFLFFCFVFTVSLEILIVLFNSLKEKNWI